MALTRKFLAALGIEAEKIDEIIAAHSETVEALKAERDGYKEDAEKYADTKEKLDEANEKLKDAGKDGSYKVKYDALKEEYDDFKSNVETEKANRNKIAACKALLKEVGIADKRIDAVAKVMELDKIKLDKDGKIEGADELKKTLATEWSDFIVKDGKEGAGTATPPGGESGGGVRTKEEIMKIKDTSERQKAWGEYLTNGGK